MPTLPNEPPIVGEIAELLASHKLVPFFGAGISRDHLGVAAAELAHQMAADLGESPEKLLSELADLYEERHGRDGFVTFLRSQLTVTAFDERKVPAHRALVSLLPSLVYTTNQDNLFELTAAKYGRRYRRVVTIDDLAEAIPGEPLLIKFHGDPDVPSSLVFGRKSYEARIATDGHPLDIKLRADLLGKRLLFLGYSLRDENVSKLLASVQRAFGGTLPPSFLVAFDDEPTLASAALTYQIEYIVPGRLYPEAASTAEAFERFLVALCDGTRQRQSAAGLENLLSDRPINPRIVTDFEMAAAETAISSGPFSTAYNAFRSTFDGTFVPEHMQDRVLKAFQTLAGLVQPTDQEEMDELRFALFNLKLPPVQAMTAVATFMAHCNQRPTPGSFDPFITVPCPAIPDEAIPGAAAIAVAMLGAREEAVTDNFRRLARHWFRGWEAMPEPARGSTRQMIEAAWPGHLSSQSPINQPLHVPPGLGRGFHAIRDDLMAHFPKQPVRPSE
jgi:SIR2-like domain